MRSKTLAYAVAMSAAVLASPVAASLSDFRLPADRPQQQPPTDLQGPVAPDVPASRRTQATPTPTTSASPAVTPAPTATPPPSEVPTGRRATPSGPTRGGVAPVPTTPAPSTPVADAPPPASTAMPTPDATAPRLTPPPGPAPSTAPRDDAGWSWLWSLAAVTLLLVMLALAGWGARHWVRRPIGAVAVPQVERPRVGSVPEESQPASGTAASIVPLQLSLRPLRLSLTLLNATLAYRLEIANRGPTPLTGLSIGADMIAAHASMSREEQLSGPRTGNGSGPTQRIERLEPGEARVVEGEFRLPFPQIIPIRQGDAVLLLPLARFRVEVDGTGPVVRTFVVGQPGQGSSLQPFRLDQGPRVYPRLAQHAFA